MPAVAGSVVHLQANSLHFVLLLLLAAVNCYVAMSCGGDPVPDVHSITQCCNGKYGITYLQKNPRGSVCVAW